MSGTDARQLIYDLTFPELERMVAALDEPKFRAAQIWEGLYKSHWSKIEHFSNLSKALRQQLESKFIFQSLTIERTLASSDSETTKVLFHTPDSRAIETVLMRYDRRRTLCISTQSGCAMGCTFCATGQMGLGRNLSS
ncbi:MAG: 23S rRNA (adenine(2503)-C2)-methyltransferase, partial [Anaerolineae bacterium]|nr:23S rRNA (adenine(2503)-C2)-methyltransferase [Anaerolineae bacterium]